MEDLHVDIYERDREIHWHVPKVGLFKSRLEKGRLELFKEHHKTIGARDKNGELIHMPEWQWNLPRLWAPINPTAHPNRQLANRALLRLFMPEGEIVFDFSYFGNRVPDAMLQHLSLQIPKKLYPRERAKKNRYLLDRKKKEFVNAQGLDGQGPDAELPDQDRLQQG